MNLRRLGTVVGAVAVTLVPAACSGGDDGGASSTSTGSSLPTTAATTAAPQTSDASSTSVTTPESTAIVPDSTEVVDSLPPGEEATDTTITLDSVETDDEPDAPEPPAQEKLPGDGPATVGGISLPAGTVLETNEQRLAWITTSAVPGAAAVWQQLWAVSGQTGLYPVLLYDDGEDPGWEDEYFFPNQPFDLDNIAYTDVLESAAELSFDEPRTFDGLAGASTAADDTAAADAEVAALPDARILLVESPSGADALSYMGWTGNATYDSTEALCVAIRSWAERFGARLVAIGPTRVTLTISRPPSSSADATLLGKELVLMDPPLETGGAPLPVVQLGDALTTQHAWTLWWE